MHTLPAHILLGAACSILNAALIMHSASQRLMMHSAAWQLCTTLSCNGGDVELSTLATSVHLHCRAGRVWSAAHKCVELSILALAAASTQHRHTIKYSKNYNPGM